MNRVIENIIVVVAVLIAIAIGFGIYAWSGVYNIGADAHHTKPVLALMTVVRDRSLNAYSADIKVHNLNNRRLILKGARQSLSNRGKTEDIQARCTGPAAIDQSRREDELLPHPVGLWRLVSDLSTHTIVACTHHSPPFV